MDLYLTIFLIVVITWAVLFLFVDTETILNIVSSTVVIIGCAYIGYMIVLYLGLLYLFLTIIIMLLFFLLIKRA